MIFSQAKRKRIYERDGYACWYCGLGLAKETIILNGTCVGQQSILLLPTLDHLEPRIKGGYDLDSNLVTSCRKCNSQKGKKSVEEYRSYLGRKNDSATIVFWGEKSQQPAPLQF